MITLLYIYLLGVFAFHCTRASRNGVQIFRGTYGIIVLAISSFFGTIGYITYASLLGWSFWHFAWWKPVVVFVAGLFPLTPWFFDKTLIGVTLSIIGVIVFASLSIIELISL